MKSNQTEFLEKVNHDLKTVILIAAPDFAEVNGMLKVYYENRCKADSALLKEFPLLENKLDRLVSNLQYMDILTQRVEHLILIHVGLKEKSDDPGLKESLFHLHVFQSMTIELDLLKSIKAIITIIEELQNHFSEIGKIDLQSHKYFTNTTVITAILSDTILSLSVAGGEIRHLPIPPLSPRQIQVLNAHYTMESERVVLNWFLESMPRGRWEDLFHHYESAIEQVEIEKTELF